MPSTGQLRADMCPDGMLASAATVEAVAMTLVEYKIPTVVLDPVCGLARGSENIR